MFKNYLKIAWRNLIKNSAYSVINIGGLAIGITACLLILQYVSYETSYEDFHENKDRVFRVKQERYNAGKLETEWAGGAFAVGQLVQRGNSRNRGICKGCPDPGYYRRG